MLWLLTVAYTLHVNKNLFGYPELSLNVFPNTQINQ